MAQFDAIDEIGQRDYKVGRVIMALPIQYYGGDFPMNIVRNIVLVFSLSLSLISSAVAQAQSDRPRLEMVLNQPTIGPQEIDGQKMVGIRRVVYYKLPDVPKKTKVTVTEKVTVIGLDKRLATPPGYQRTIRVAGKATWSDELFFGDQVPLPQGSWFNVRQELFLNGATVPFAINEIDYTLESISVVPQPALLVAIR